MACCLMLFPPLEVNFAEVLTQSVQWDIYFFLIALMKSSFVLFLAIIDSISFIKLIFSIIILKDYFINFKHQPASQPANCTLKYFYGWENKNQIQCNFEKQVEQILNSSMIGKSQINVSYSRNDSTMESKQMSFVHKMYRTYQNKFWNKYAEKYISSLSISLSSKFNNISQIRAKSQKSENSHILQNNILNQLNNEGQKNEIPPSLSSGNKQKTIRQQKAIKNDLQMKKKTNNVQVIEINAQNKSELKNEHQMKQKVGDERNKRIINKNQAPINKFQSKQKKIFQNKDNFAYDKKGDNKQQEEQQQAQIQQVVGSSYYDLITKKPQSINNDDFDVPRQLVTKSHLNHKTNIQFDEQILSKSVIVNSNVAQISNERLEDMSKPLNEFQQEKQQINSEIITQIFMENKQIKQDRIQSSANAESIVVSGGQNQDSGKRDLQGEGLNFFKQISIAEQEEKSGTQQKYNNINKEEEQEQMCNKSKQIYKDSQFHQLSPQIPRDDVQEDNSILKIQNESASQKLKENPVQYQYIQSNIAYNKEGQIIQQKQNEIVESNIENIQDEQFIKQDFNEQYGVIVHEQINIINASEQYQDEVNEQTNSNQDVSKIQPIQRQREQLDNEVQIIFNNFVTFLDGQAKSCQICMQNNLQKKELNCRIQQVNQQKNALESTNITQFEKITELEIKIKQLQQKIQKEQFYTIMGQSTGRRLQGSWQQNRTKNDQEQNILNNLQGKSDHQIDDQSEKNPSEQSGYEQEKREQNLDKQNEQQQNNGQNSD